MKPSRLKYWMNFVALVSGLVLCIFFIFMMKSEHGRQFWSSLGFGGDGDTLNWCSNRVQTLNLPLNNGSLVEESGKWLWKAPDLPDVELDYLSVEKWFAKHCQFPIKKVAMGLSAVAISELERNFQADSFSFLRCKLIIAFIAIASLRNK